MFTILHATTAFAQDPAAQAPPRLLNAPEIRELIATTYPRSTAGNVSGTVMVRVHVTAQSTVDSAYLSITSGSYDLDGAAAVVASRLQFVAAMTGGNPVATWIDVPLHFIAPSGHADNATPAPLTNRDSINELLLNSGVALPDKDTRRVVGTSLSIRPDGSVRKVRFNTGANFGALSERAEAAGKRMRFASGTQQTNAYVLYSHDTAFVHAAGDSLPRVAPKMTDAAGTQYDYGPVLQNHDALALEMFRAYPPGLRPPRKGATTTVGLFVDENGDVAKTLVVASSGSAELDAAAMSVLKVMKFLPATVDCRTVGRWHMYPLTFSAP